MTLPTMLVATLALWTICAIAAFGAPPRAYESGIWVAKVPSRDVAPRPQTHVPVLRVPVPNDNAAQPVDDPRMLFRLRLRLDTTTEMLPVALVLNQPGQFDRALKYLSDRKARPSVATAAEPSAWVLPLVDNPAHHEQCGYTVDQVAEMRAVIPRENALRVSNLEKYRKALQDFARKRHVGWFGRWRSRYGAANVKKADVAVKPVLFIHHLPRTTEPLEARVLMQHTTVDKGVSLHFSEPLARHFELVPE